MTTWSISETLYAIIKMVVVTGNDFMSKLTHLTQNYAKASAPKLVALMAIVPMLLVLLQKSPPSPSAYMPGTVATLTVSRSRRTNNSTSSHQPIQTPNH